MCIKNNVVLRNTILLFCFFISIKTGYSQILSSQPDKTNTFYAGVVPSALANQRIGYQGKIGVYLKDEYEFNFNYGFIKGNFEDKYQGKRIKLEARRLLGNVPEINDNSYVIPYVGIGYLHRSISSILQGEFSLLVPDNLPLNLGYQNISTVNGGYLTYGANMFLENRFVLDFGLGLGYGQNKVENTNIPEQFSLINEPEFSQRSPGTYPFPIVIVHFSISYIL